MKDMTDGDGRNSARRRAIMERKRKRRRNALIKAYSILISAFIVIVLIIVLIVHAIIGAVNGGSKTAEVTATPVQTSSVYVPEGYESIYKKLVSLSKTYPELDNVIINLSQYPEDILNMAIKNQETIDFVVNYPKNKGATKVSSPVTEGAIGDGIPHFLQWDERWGYIAYGSDIIATDGCGPTCLSMVCTGLLQKVKYNPAYIAKFSTNNNYYTQDTGTAWTLMSSGAEKLGLSVESLSVSADNINSALEAGKPIICSMMPGDFTTEGHFIVLTGVTDDGKITLNDPNSIARSEKEWDVDTLVGQIKTMWSYSV